MASRKLPEFNKQDESVQARLDREKESPDNRGRGTLFEFFKNKTKKSLDKSYANAIKNKRSNSTAIHEREETNISSNLSFLKKLNETMSPKKSPKKTPKKAASLPESNEVLNMNPISIEDSSV
jgi:ATP-dependent helicase YprA (DUF1998 family)